MTLRERAGEMVWPRAGYRRSARYGVKRLMRLRASPHAIAAGFAAGAFASFTPLMGFHFILSALLALATRGSIIASALGTAVGNPLTFPLIWAGTYKLGWLVMGGNGNDPDLDAQMGGGNVLDLIQTGLVPILLPMAVGGVILGSIAWIIAYFPIRRLIWVYQRRRAERLAATREARAQGGYAEDGDASGVETGYDDPVGRTRRPDPRPVRADMTVAEG